MWGALLGNIVVVESFSFCNHCSLPTGQGGGLYGEWTSASIAGLVVKACSATTAGGCIALKSSSTRFTDLDASGCTAVTGGALSIVSGSAVQLTGGSISSSAATSGAAIFIDASTVDGQNLLLTNCSASRFGGGATLVGNRSRLSGTMIQKCSAAQGGGVFAWSATQAALAQVEMKNNTASLDGGGVYANDSDIAITNVRVASNSATRGGGLYAVNSNVLGSLKLESNDASYGGGAAVSGTVVLNATVLNANRAQRSGGGIFARDGDLTLRNVDILACTATNGVGGGMSLENARTAHDRVLLSRCTALVGGGLYLNSSSFSPVTSSAPSPVFATLSSNEATSSGGSVYLIGASASVDRVSVVGGSAVSGGGIASEYATECTISNADIRNATAASLGGGIYVGENADCVLRNILVEANSAERAGGGVAVFQGTLRHSNLIVQRNKAKNGGGLFVSGSSAASSTIPVVSVVQWSGDPLQQSLLDANFVSSNTFTGANVLIECVTVCEVSDFRITRGDIPSGRGGGVFISGKGATTLSKLLIEGNRAQLGGGVYVDQASSTIFNSMSITGNIGQRGAGLGVASTSSALTRVSVNASIFYNNSATLYGGAVYLSGATFTATSMLVLENRATQNDSGQGGGVLALAKSSISIGQSLLLLNDALYGGSIAVTEESQATVEASTITRDSERFSSSWAALFKRVTRTDYMGNTTAADFQVKSRRGGLVFASDESTALNITSSYLTYGSAESGGGASVENGAVMTVESSELSHNRANESGGSVFVSTAGAKATFDVTEISFSSTRPNLLFSRWRCVPLRRS